MKALNFAVLLTVLFALLAGCAPRIPVRDPAATTRIWSTLRPVNSPDRLTARFSLHVQTKKRTGRLVGQIWGYPESVMRMDLASGTGMSVAMIRETPDQWTAYLPSENQAYRHSKAQDGLALFQIPVPFTARQTGSLLAGNLGPILPPGYDSIQGGRDGGIRFTFSSGEVAYLELPENMETMVLGGRKGWTLTCENPYALPAFPDHVLFDKFTFSSPKEGKAVLRVKSLESVGGWQAQDLNLNMPQDVQWMRVTSRALNN